MKFKCPHCGQKYNDKASTAGEEVTCGECDKVFVIEDPNAVDPTRDQPITAGFAIGSGLFCLIGLLGIFGIVTASSIQGDIGVAALIASISVTGSAFFMGLVTCFLRDILFELRKLNHDSKR